MNPTAAPLFIYLLPIDADGQIYLPTFWSDEDVTYLGLQPRQTEESYPFQLFDKPGLYEARFFATTTRIRYFVAPPSVATRGMMPRVEADGMTMKAVRYQIVS